MLYVLGLGPGDPGRLPLRAFSLLTGTLPLYIRTTRHPVFEDARFAGLVQRPDCIAFDSIYETASTFEETYNAIVERITDAARGGDAIYAVPGHPLLGETTVARLIPRLQEERLAFQIIGAPSFMDACLETLGQAITDDLTIVDALNLSPDDPSPPEILRAGGPLLLYQVHSRAAASQAKLALMKAGYPDEFPVTVVRAAGVPGREVTYALPLYELDRDTGHDHLTSVWVPPLPADARRPGFAGLVRVMARLRDPERGCPWDKEQTHQTLRRYVLEEAYEVAEAIDAGDPEQLCDELGDLLLQVVFHAQLAAEEGTFDSEDVCQAIVDKMIRRHPHVFGKVKAEDADTVLKNWQAIKAAEKGNAARTSILDGVPASYPALMAALEISKRAVKVGFEWPDITSILAKVDEELAELRAEILADAPVERIADELGDLLFTVVNVARRAGVEPETALRRQLTRFKRRFQYIEAKAMAMQRPLETLSLSEMESYWQDAKVQEKENRQ